MKAPIRGQMVWSKRTGDKPVFHIDCKNGYGQIRVGRSDGIDYFICSRCKKFSIGISLTLAQTSDVSRPASMALH